MTLPRFSRVPTIWTKPWRNVCTLGNVYALTLIEYISALLTLPIWGKVTFPCLFHLADSQMSGSSEMHSSPHFHKGAYRVHKQGLYPGQERERLLLAKPESIREPGALAVWHETLRELGLESRVL
jgi:hypothetical protein